MASSRTLARSPWQEAPECARATDDAVAVDNLFPWQARNPACVDRDLVACLDRRLRDPQAARVEFGSGVGEDANPKPASSRCGQGVEHGRGDDVQGHEVCQSHPAAAARGLCDTLPDVTLPSRSNSGRAADDAPIRVLFLPDFGDANPYQRELRAALEARGVRVSGARAPGRDPASILHAWLTHGRPGVVHLHWTHNYLGQRVDGSAARLPGVRAALFLGQLRILRALRVRVVWTVHNLGHHDQREADTRSVRIHHRLVGIADAVICHCEAAREAAVVTYGLRSRDRDKLHVIPHGNYVDVYGPAVDRAAARERLGIPPDARVLLFVGAVRAYKGLAELTDAFRRVTESGARLVIAGKPATQADTDGLAAAAAHDPRIDLRLGFVPDDELPALLGAADAIVLPFRDILTSGSAILAMSYGRAVVAPSLGCLAETLDADSAVLYRPSGLDALASALETALASDLDAKGAHALVVATRLAWGPIGAATAELYLAAAGGGR